MLFQHKHTQKKAGRRQIPMQDYVKEALIRERKYQEYNGIACKQEVDGYTDFIFINRFGNCQHQGTLNKALRRIIRDCNDRQLEKDGKNAVLLPNFSCHSLRHTFVTRLYRSRCSSSGNTAACRTFQFGCHFGYLHNSVRRIYGT